MGAFGCTIALFLSSLMQLFEVPIIPIAVIALAVFSIALIAVLYLNHR